MAKIAEYTAPKEKLTPSREGYQAWEQAGRRIGPAYNEAANLMDRGQTLETQASDLAANQQDKLQRALLSQYKDLYDAINAASRTGTGSRAAGGGGFRVSGDRSGRPIQPSNPQAVSEISNGAAQLAGILNRSGGRSKLVDGSGEDISYQTVVGGSGYHMFQGGPDEPATASGFNKAGEPTTETTTGNASGGTYEYHARDPYEGHWSSETGTQETWNSAMDPAYNGADPVQGPPQPFAQPSSGLLNFSWLNSLTSGADPAAGPDAITAGM